METLSCTKIESPVDGLFREIPESKSTKNTRTDARSLSLYFYQDLVDRQGRRTQGKNRVASHHSVGGNLTAEYAAEKLKKGDHLYVVGNAREQCL